MSDGSFLGVVGNYFPKAGPELSRGPAGHSHRTTTLLPSCAALSNTFHNLNKYILRLEQRVTATLCCSIQTLYGGAGVALGVQRTVWPVRNVVPTTAPIYPHKFPSKLTILTQARPTTPHTEQKPHKGSQVGGRITYKRY